MKGTCKHKSKNGEKHNGTKGNILWENKDLEQKRMNITEPDNRYYSRDDGE